METVCTGITVNIDVCVFVRRDLTQVLVTDDHYGFDGVNGSNPSQIHNACGIESVYFVSRLLWSMLSGWWLHLAVCTQY